MRTRMILLLLSVVALVGACAAPQPLPTPTPVPAMTPEQTTPTPTPRSAERQAAPRDVQPADVAVGNRFTFDLLKQVATAKPGQNTVLSPISVGLALAMTANGANGETSEAMLRTLAGGDINSLDSLNETYAALQSLLMRSDEGSVLKVANSIWMREGEPIYDDFLARVGAIYTAEIREIDFRSPDAVNTINAWVSSNTEGRIPSIIEKISDEDVMFLLNAIYFKGAWVAPFDKDATQEAPFNLANGQQKSVPLMFKGGRMDYLEGEGFQAARLYYKGGTLRTTIVLPANDRPLEALIAELDADRWTAWQAEFMPRQGSLYLPRFTVEFQQNLRDALTGLGMGIAFTADADFSGMRPVHPTIAISKVQHRTFLEMNEEGAEAAAVTSVEMGVTSAMPGPEEPFEMRVDRPFLITIEDTATGLPLFIGAIYEP